MTPEERGYHSGCIDVLLILLFATVIIGLVVSFIRGV